MKVLMLQENLADAVVRAGRATSTRHTLPQTGCLLLETVDGRVRVTGTDLETVIAVYAGAQVIEKGAALVPAARLGKVLASFDDVAIDLETEGKNGLSLTSTDPASGAQNGRTFKLAGQDPADYPPVPETPEHVATVSGGQLRRVLSRVLDCVATNDTRPVLAAVNFQSRDGRLVLAAADGFRLAVHELDYDGEDFPNVNVPAKTLKELLRVLPKPKDDWDDVLIHMATGPCGAVSDPNSMRFRLGGGVFHDVICRTIIGTFPNYHQLIPVDFEGSAKVLTDALRREIDAARVLVQDDSGIVRLELGDDTLTVRARAEDVGEFEGVVAGEVEGAGKIAFNVHYLTTFLKTVGTEAVELRVNSPSSPGLWLPVDDPDYSVTIMPMFVQWNG